MNGFSLMADTYRKAAEQGKLDKATADKTARVLDFLSTCDTDDMYTMFDSTAFNEIAKSYMRAAVANLIENGTIDDEQGKAIRNEYAFLFSEKTAKEISEG